MSRPVQADCVPPDPDEAEERPKSVLGKAQLLLAAFGSGAFRLRLTELSRRSGVPKATAYRLAQELTQWGLLERVGGGYQLGLRVFELGQRVPVAAVVRRVSRPLLVDLFAATRATIHLAILDGAHVLYLEKVAGEANVHTHSEVGVRLPASCTATGKVLLALGPGGAAAVDRYQRTGLYRLTPRSAPTVTVLCRQLAEVRQHGFAIEMGETLSGYGSVATPVTGADGVVYAAVSATLPANRLVVSRLVPQLQSTSAGIARAVERKITGPFSTTGDLLAFAGRGGPF
jgi:DNA-binding IclR family transcriptional regulator